MRQPTTPLCVFANTNHVDHRHFAMTELRVFLAILLSYATVEVDEECSTRPEFAIERMGLGVMHPRGDIDVILRKRKL